MGQSVSVVESYLLGDYKGFGDGTSPMSDGMMVGPTNSLSNKLRFCFKSFYLVLVRLFLVCTATAEVELMVWGLPLPGGRYRPRSGPCQGAWQTALSELHWDLPHNRVKAATA